MPIWRTSSVAAMIAAGACAGALSTSSAMAKSGFVAAPVHAMPQTMPRAAVVPAARPAAPIARPGLPAHVRPPMAGHGHRHGRRFINVGLGAPYLYGAYASGAVESEPAVSPPPEGAAGDFGQRLVLPSPCVPPTLIIIGSGMKGAVTPPAAPGGGCTTPQVIHQTRADLKAPEGRSKKRALRARY